MHNYNEQFFQVGLLDRALISLGLALSPSSDFMVLCKCFFSNYTYFIYLVEGLAWWDWPLTSGLTNYFPSVLDTICWVI